jgi:putative oxidoreductase
MDKSKISDSTLFFLILRMLIGVIFIYHGFPKILDMNKWINFMSTKGIPSVVAIFAGWIELIIGICLIFGILTRISAFFAAVFMIIAIILVHIGDPILTYIYQIALLNVSLILIFAEPGILSIDNFLNLKSELK